jgi:hypothetical protein
MITDLHDRHTPAQPAQARTGIGLLVALAGGVLSLLPPRRGSPVTPAPVATLDHLPQRADRLEQGDGLPRAA